MMRFYFKSFVDGVEYIHAFKPGGNNKTGNVDYSVFHFVAGTHPNDSISSGLDSVTNCKGCPLASNNGCYVNSMPMGMYTVYKSVMSGKYIEVSEPEVIARIAGLRVRFGGYGNPSTMGYSKNIFLSVPRLALSYDHDDFSGDSMISVHNEADAVKYQAIGLRTYRTLSPGERPLTSEIMCPYYGPDKTPCAQCGLCDARKKAKSIAVEIHGSGKRFAIEAIS